jgi:V/A-type H+-transporting ATPase subunit I
MFYPQEMARVQVIIPARDLTAVTKELAVQGVFHQVDSSKLVADAGKVPQPFKSWLEVTAAYASLEHRILTIMQALSLVPERSLPSPEAEVVGLERILPIVDEIDQQVNRIREQVNEKQKHLDEFKALYHQLEPLIGGDLDLQTLRTPGYIYSILGTMPSANLERLQTSLERIPFVFESLSQDEETAIVWLSSLKRDREILDRAARSAYLNPIVLPGAFQGTSAQVIETLQRSIEDTRQQISDEAAKLAEIRDSRGEQIQNLFTQIRSSRVLTEAMSHFGRFRYTYLITGWVPATRLDDFEHRLKVVSKNILVESASVPRAHLEEDVPVVLHNAGIFRPFQTLVTTYGQPRYEEMDPTVLMAISFPLLFGAMFGDIGHGLLLALLGALLGSRMVRALRSLANFGWIIAYCGISSIVFGVLYGNLFGFEDLLKPLLIRPMNSILESMILAIGVGVVLLSVGYLVFIVNSLTAKEWGPLLFGHHGIAGLVLYWSLVGVAVEVRLGTPGPQLKTASSGTSHTANRIAFIVPVFLSLQ